MKKVFLMMALAGGMLSACSTTSDKEAGQEQAQDENGAANQTEMSSPAGSGPDSMQADTANHSHSHSHGGTTHEHGHEHNAEHKH